MRGVARWCLAMGGMGALVAGCHGAPWQHVAPTPDACVQRSAIKQEIATLETKLKKGDFPATPPVLVAASAAGGSGSAGGPMGGSAQGLALEKRAASVADGGASPQAASNVSLAKAAYDMDENAALQRKATANVAGIGTAGSAVEPATATVKEAAAPAPATKAQAQARIRVLQKQLWDLPSGSSCAKMEAGASAAS